MQKIRKRLQILRRNLFTNQKKSPYVRSHIWGIGGAPIQDNSRNLFTKMEEKQWTSKDTRHWKMKNYLEQHKSN